VETLVVVGYGTAGMTAAGFATIHSRRALVKVFEKRPYAIYHPCSLPDVISGELDSSRVVEEAPRGPRLEVQTATLVEEVDASARRVRARNLRSGEVVEVEYSRLILATGGVPFIPRSVKILNSDGVYTLRTVEDAVAIAEAAARHREAVVVGGSALGVEVAYALAKRGCRVRLVEYFPQLMPGKMDQDISAEVRAFLEGRGVEVILGRAVSEIGGEAGGKRVVAGGEELTAGFVVAATGVRPSTELARSMGLDIGPTGGVKVDEHMRTSAEDVYAAGDVAEVKSMLTGQPTLSQFASTAYIMGRVAGINAAGGREAFRGVLQNWIVNLDGFQFGAVGLTEEEAAMHGLEPVSATVSAADRPAFYPGSAEMKVKLVASGRDGRILGFQAAGRGNVLEKLNLFSALIAGGATVSDLFHVELAYTPTLNEVVGPVYVVADALARRLARRLAREF